jgi:hypothetical protein
MVDSAQNRTKVFLDTYVTGTGITKDDGITQAPIIKAFDLPDYPLSRVFIDKAIDVIFSIGQATSSALIDSDHYPLGYREHVPISVFAMDKTGITGIKVLEKAEAVMRAAFEANPIASLRRVSGMKPLTERIGGAYLWACEYSLDYERGLT